MKRGASQRFCSAIIGAQKPRRPAVVVAVAILLLGPHPGEVTAQALAPMPGLTPAGWTMRVSTNSVYFTRPDIPNVQVGFINDIRPQLTQDQKFEFAKTFFSQSAGCPALATAETQNSFGGLSAWDGDPGLFSPAAITMYHAKNECRGFDWRWKEGVEGGDVASCRGG